MANPLQKMLQELSMQKEAYHRKMLTVDGEFTLYQRQFQVYDLMMDISNLLIPEFFMSSLSTSLLFDFDLTNLEPLNLEFTWRIPTLDEWLRGVGVVIESVIPDYAKTLEEFVSTNIKSMYQPSIMETRVTKGYYGEARYDYAYYDPAAVREFLRNTITLMWKKHSTWIQRKTNILSMARSLNVLEDLARNVHDRMSMIITAHTEAFILDYGFLDISKLCEEAEHSEENAIVPYTDMDGVGRSVEIVTLADMQHGFILDVSLLDYGFLMPDEDIYVANAPVIVDALDDKMRRYRDRVTLTAPAFSNYVRGDEAVDYTKCERTEVWGELMAYRYTVDAQVQSILDKIAPELNIYDKRKYVSAVLQLLGHLGKRHEWGYKVYKSMEDPELKKWWMDYWGSQGLNLNVLDTLYEMVKVWLPQIVREKLSLGRKVRLRRLGIQP